MDPITTAVVSTLASKATDKAINWAKENPDLAMGAAGLVAYGVIATIISPNPPPINGSIPTPRD
jgi:hypothetical protein